MITDRLLNDFDKFRYFDAAIVQSIPVQDDKFHRVK